MEIDLDVYFWMIDRGVLDDDSRNKIFADTNHCRLHREHYKKLQNGVYIAQVMIMLKKTLIRQHDGPVAIDPQVTKLKDNITEAAKLYNWSVITKELRKFGIKVTQERKQKLVESESYIIVRNILYELY
jgi:formylmethanofuran dehydrogenase subunit B